MQEEDDAHGGNPDVYYAGPSTPAHADYTTATRSRGRAKCASHQAVDNPTTSGQTVSGCGAETPAHGSSVTSSPSGPRSGPMESSIPTTSGHDESSSSSDPGSSGSTDAIALPAPQWPVTRSQRGIVQPKKLYKGMI
jgi:hypothetical protein